MSRVLYSTAVSVPDLPRVRFLKRMPLGSARPFEDVTRGVEGVRIVSLTPDDTVLALERVDGKQVLVWSTKHKSVEEARWQAEFEYGIDAAAWHPEPAANGHVPHSVAGDSVKPA